MAQGVEPSRFGCLPSLSILLGLDPELLIQALLRTDHLGLQIEGAAHGLVIHLKQVLVVLLDLLRAQLGDVEDLLCLLETQA